MKVHTPTADTDLAWCTELGYRRVIWRGPAGVCGLYDYLWTCGLVVGLTPAEYRGRYCYASRAEAEEALARWDGHGDPPGAWIKYKGAGAERLGPGALGLPPATPSELSNEQAA